MPPSHPMLHAALVKKTKKVIRKRHNKRAQRHRDRIAKLHGVHPARAGR